MQYHDPQLGVAFVAAIFIVAIFVTLFPEKEPEPKNTDPEHLNKKNRTDGAGDEQS